MTNVDDVLEQCLTDVVNGASNVEECLARYPEHATQLEPLLRTAAHVEIGSKVRPSPAFKARTRARLTIHMQANPRKRVGISFPFGRLVTGLVTILLTLFVTGTVYAQGVFPGDPFYGWKLISEHAWRLVSSDTVTTDLRIANRRIDEMNVTVKDHAKWTRALKGYSEVRSRLEDEIDRETLDTILPPADALSYPNATATNGPGSEPKETKSPSSKDKDKDKDPKKDDNGKENKEPEDSLPAPATEAPKPLPTIEIPPPTD